MGSSRDSLGRFRKGTRPSRATEFKKGQHWRPHRKFRERAYLEREYLENGRSASEIAKEWGVTENAIMFWLTKLGIPRRSIGQARAVKWWGAVGSTNPMFGKFGKQSPNYKHGKTPERQRSYGRYFWKQLVKLIHERDGQRCVRCGRDTELGTHHLKSWTRVPEARYDVAQIVTMCKPCHHWIHSKRNVNHEYLSS